ncbi:MAG: type II toxin-antitoxin system VapC family toxin [Actinomycetota bacterium]
MILPDVNVLVYALREDSSAHVVYRRWLESVVEAAEPVALADLVLSGVVRVLTHPKVFATPNGVGEVLEELARLRGHPNVVPVAPGPRHWNLFAGLCRAVQAKGNVVPDAYLAALALESGSTFATADRGFARFPNLRLLHPAS